MRSNNVSTIIRWWVTPKLPVEHIFIPPEKRPKGLYPTIRVYFRKWTVHPIKRWIAHFYVRLLQRFFGLKVVALTGSTGKTTTKEMVASILREKGQTIWTYANEDPIYNIPTTILKCHLSTQYLVLEMGVEFPGEMDFYLWLAQPKVALITNIYQTHTQFFGDVEGVAKEKAKLVENMQEGSLAVLNKDNIYCRRIGKKVNTTIIWFGKTGFVRATDIKITPDLNTKYILFVGKQSVEITLPTLGEQFVENSVSAAATAWACGASLAQIKAGLESFKPVEHRMRPLRLKNGTLVLDDSYNSNPSAAKAALETLHQVAGKRTTVAVLGDMLELGKDQVERHKEIGRLAAEIGVHHLIGVGPLSKHIVEAYGSINSAWVESTDRVIPLLKPHLKKNSVVLIKASRSIGLDKLIPKLQILTP